MISKSELRTEARALRKRLAEATPDAANRLAAHADPLLDALFGREAGWVDEAARGRRLTVALYRARGAEIDPAALARALAQRSCDLCLPVVEVLDAPLVFRAWSPGQTLAPDLAGSPAPLADAARVEPDLILCPLLAFDRFGGRLGQGGGYYDRTLAARPGIAFVGLAYAGQEAERLPMEGHDIRLHGVLTEVGYTACRKV
ncbi:MAG: 5-formyltetrahydrofolate cyclo-ligase [Brevundimonas sp.]|uniref:5-formyltetrahydrofolate cyclo-ligase n=1 Tax=Brevundimonas sp. TaxID=1871086 RepID=UPI0025C3F06E|nr:5-formyltetrahydrofolate cyclo-ligase [Brevundimonas sp.]MBX3477644.1 5-formyltetrahydrofolate cyclo-ligase [Brevundimonas sp.]